jgi:hypothetical protein
MFSKFRRSISLTLAGLMLVGGVPRIVCVCLSTECVTACELNGFNFFAPRKHAAQTQGCCCCKENVEAASGDPAVAADPCGRQCETIVKHTELSPTPRATELAASPSVTWLATPEGFPLQHQRIFVRDWTSPLRVPPDDPVSRAQILRI